MIEFRRNEKTGILESWKDRRYIGEVITMGDSIIRDSNVKDRAKGCLIGGAIGDALGYVVEFLDEESIFTRFGEDGITVYSIFSNADKAVISDDTQMTLFTACGLLNAAEDDRKDTEEDAIYSVVEAYGDWLYTQNHDYRESNSESIKFHTRLMEIPELYQRRAPGNTCLSALHARMLETGHVKSFIHSPINNSKGCGGIMRVAPYAIFAGSNVGEDTVLLEGAEIAAVTHSHSLGYMPAAALVFIIHEILYGFSGDNLKKIVMKCKDALQRVFSGDPHLPALIRIIDLAMELSEIPDMDDLDNIHKIGEGWVAEETLGIALYCALKYSNDFDKGIIASVNHNGDSDSTGAVTGNMLGALIGYNRINEKWKDKLELKDEIIKISDELYEKSKQ